MLKKSLIWLSLIASSVSLAQIEVKDHDLGLPPGCTVLSMPGVSRDGERVLITTQSPRGNFIVQKTWGVSALPNVIEGALATPLAISLDGNHVLFSATNAYLYSYSLLTANFVRVDVGTSNVSSFGFTSDGSKVVFATSGSRIYQWVPSGALTPLLNFAANRPLFGSMSGGGELVMFAQQNPLGQPLGIWKYTSTAGATLLTTINDGSTNIPRNGKPMLTEVGDHYLMQVENASTQQVIATYLARTSDNGGKINFGTSPAKSVGFNGNSVLAGSTFWRRDVGFNNAKTLIDTFYSPSPAHALAGHDVNEIVQMSSDVSTFWGLSADRRTAVSMHNADTFRRKIGERFSVEVYYSAPIFGPIDPDDSTPNTIELFYTVTSPFLSPTTQAKLATAAVPIQSYQQHHFQGNPNLEWIFADQTTLGFTYSISDRDFPGTDDILMSGLVKINLSDLRSGYKEVATTGGKLTFVFDYAGPVCDPNS